ncbi:hypothetical protein TRVL_04208 [Trypanosoma vivax]|nr:hypothetical protein TRVL_04208 [Trypanosoma vivax]
MKAPQASSRKVHVDNVVNNTAGLTASPQERAENSIIESPVGGYPSTSAPTPRQLRVSLHTGDNDASFALSPLEITYGRDTPSPQYKKPELLPDTYLQMRGTSASTSLQDSMQNKQFSGTHVAAEVPGPFETSPSHTDKGDEVGAVSSNGNHLTEHALERSDLRTPSVSQRKKSSKKGANTESRRTSHGSSVMFQESISSHVSKGVRSRRGSFRSPSKSGKRKTSRKGTPKSRQTPSSTAGTVRSGSPATRSRSTGRGSPVNSMRGRSSGKSSGQNSALPASGRKKYLGTLIRDEERERKELIKQAQSEHHDIMLQVFVESYKPQRRLIKSLEKRLQKQTEEADIRVANIENSNKKLFESTVHLIDSVYRAGANAVGVTQMLDVEVPFVTEVTSPRGKRLSCVSQPSNQLLGRDANRPMWSADEVREIEKIKSFFSDYGEVREPGAGLKHDTGAYSSEDKVHEAHKEVMRLSEALTNLITRSYRMIEEGRQIIKAQQRSLNEGVTRVEIADGILKETTEQHCIDIDYACSLFRQLSVELRHRMDRIENEVLCSLEGLINDSMEVCIKNRAFNNQVQLQENKENAVDRYITKMEMVVIEQGKLLRDVRLKLLDLWKRRCNVGDEERATLNYSGLPPGHRESLNSCDHETLHRLLHFLSLNSDDARELLIAALDERKSFLESNTEEAIAVLQRCSLEASVRELLEKLHEEGDIKSRPGQSAATFEEKIRDLVQHYDKYMEDLGKKQRKAARRRARENNLVHRPFFDEKTPVPEEYAEDLDERPVVMKRRNVGNSSTQWKLQKKPSGSGLESGLRSPKIIPSSEKNHGNAAQGSVNNKYLNDYSLPHIETCQILGYLRQSHPSAMHPNGTATVVGFGRWGGHAPRLASSSDSRCMQHDGEQWRKTVLNGSLSAAAGGGDAQLEEIAMANQPPPMVPPRKLLIKHILQDHCNDAKSLIGKPDPTCCGAFEEEFSLRKEIQFLEKAII